MSLVFTPVENLERIAADNDFKLAKLIDRNGVQLVPYNSPKVTFKDKLKQIQKRLKAVPEGIYTVVFKNGPGAAYGEHLYTIKIGNPVLNENAGQPGQTVIYQQQPQESVRGWNEALTDKQLIAELKAKVAALEAEKKQLSDELESEPDPENMSEGAGGFWTGMEKVLPTFMPMLEEGINLLKGKQDLERRRLDLAEKGINTYQPAQQQATQQQQPQREQRLRPVAMFRPAPTPDSPNWPAYLNYLERISDEAYAAEIQFLNETAPEICTLVQDIFNPEPGANEQAQ